MSSYPGKPNYLVPAKRYEIFISAFEKFVEQRQKEINKADQLMRPYELVRNALEGLKLENDVKLELTEYGVDVRIKLLDTDTREHIHHIVKTVGTALRPVHPDGEPVILPQAGLAFHYYWVLHGVKGYDDRPPDVDLYIDIPSKGTPYIHVTATEEVSTYTCTRYRASWKEVQNGSNQGATADPHRE